MVWGEGDCFDKGLYMTGFFIYFVCVNLYCFCLEGSEAGVRVEVCFWKNMLGNNTIELVWFEIDILDPCACIYISMIFRC